MEKRKRKPLSKKKRFEIFKRDGFVCQYCGRKPPEAVLEVDHIFPYSKGGTDKETNLITSCFDCNRGKRDSELSDIPPSLYTDLQLKKEKESQLLEYREFIEKLEDRFNKDIEKVENIYSSSYNNEWIFTDNFKRRVKRFLVMLPLHEVEKAMKKACEQAYDEQKALKIFQAICLNVYDQRHNI